MDVDGIFNDLAELSNNPQISKMDLMEVLRSYANMISSFDLSNVMSTMTVNVEHVPKDFYGEVHKVNVNFVLNTIKSIKDVNSNYDGVIDRNHFIYSLDFLKDKYEKGIHEDTLFMFSILGGLYHRFIIEKPIHPLDLPFPGNLKIVYDNGQYYCPARKNNLKNPVAYCKMCLCQELKF